MLRVTHGPDATEAFRGAVLPYLDAGYNLARWLTRDAVLAEDVVQDAALRALRYFGSFRGGDARAWFLRIVRNAALQALAGRAPADTLDDQIQADPADDPEAALSRVQDGERLTQALAALPETLRECLVLRELEECSYQQIADIVGAPIGTVMSRLWRARNLLMHAGGNAG